jgi:multidrug efflux pump subunit AcrA (membrane-fusion protein)
MIKIGLILILVIGLGFVAITKLKAKKEANATAQKATIYPIVVKTISPKVEKVTLTLPYLAMVENDRDVKLSARISARVLKIKSSGSRVKKGEVVVKLDTTTLRSMLKSVERKVAAAQVSLDNLEATHRRTLDLLKVQGASIEQSQKELSLIANAQAALVSFKQKEIELKNNLSYATIISPVSGVISKRFVNRGALSSPGKPLVAISSKNGFFLLVRVPTELPLVGVKFHNKEYAVSALGTTFHGLAEYKVYIGKSNLTSGDRVEVNVVTFQQKATLLPFDSILNRDGKDYVLVVNGDRAYAKEIHIIQSAEQGAVVSQNFEGKRLVLAKADILLRLLSGYLLKVKE